MPNAKLKTAMGIANNRNGYLNEDEICTEESNDAQIYELVDYQLKNYRAAQAVKYNIQHGNANGTRSIVENPFMVMRMVHAP